MEDMYDKYRSTDGCGTALAGGLVIVIAICVGIAMLFGGTSCASQKCLPETVEVHDTVVRVDSFISERVRDSIVYRDRQDSTYIYEKDSVSEKQKGDTILLTKWRVKYVYKAQSQTNSQQTTSNHLQASSSSDKETSHVKEVDVKTVRYIPKFYLWVTWCSIAWIIVRLVWCVLGWVPQTSPWRNMVQSVIDRIVKFIRLR